MLSIDKMGIHISLFMQPLQQVKQHLWDFGTQPIMLLVLYHQWEELGLEWNVDGKMSTDHDSQYVLAVLVHGMIGIMFMQVWAGRR